MKIPWDHSVSFLLHVQSRCRHRASRGTRVARAGVNRGGRANGQEVSFRVVEMF